MTLPPQSKRSKRVKKDPEVEAAVDIEEVDETEEESSSPPRRRTRVQREMVEAGDSTLKGWIESLGVHDDFKIKIERRQPKKVRLRDGTIIDISGHLETHDEFIDESEITELYGGGTYTVTLMRRNDIGRLEFFKSRTVKIPGKPNMDQYEDPTPQSNGEDSRLSAQAMNTMRELINRAPGGGATDVMPMVQAMLAPVMAQLQAAQESQREMSRIIAEKDAKLLQVIAESGKSDPQQNMLLDKMWSQESGRLESLRTQHESELRMMRDNHREDLKREQQNAKDALNRLEDSHKREVDNLQRSFDGQISAFKTSFESRIDGLKSEISRLERELGAKESEIGELRALKQQSFPDKAAELASTYEALGAVFGRGDDDAEPAKWYEKLATVVMDNPETIKSLAGIQTPPPQLPPAQIAQAPGRDPNLPPPGVPFQLPNDPHNVYVSDAAGNMRQMTPEEIQQAQAEHAAAVAAAEKEARRPTPEQMKIATTFIETAIRGGKDPVEFAESARSMIPADILRYIEEEGIDSFLEDAHLESSSPLRSQNGRNWIRKVAKYLLEGTTE